MHWGDPDSTAQSQGGAPASDSALEMHPPLKVGQLGWPFRREHWSGHPCDVVIGTGSLKGGLWASNHGAGRVRGSGVTSGTSRHRLINL